MTAQILTFEARQGRTRARPLIPPYASLEIHRHADPVLLDVWADLEAAVPCSIYQTRAWLLPWIETLGRKACIDPVFVIARDANQRAIALLCLGLQRVGPIRAAVFLGRKDSNFNLALMRPGPIWARAALRGLLRDIAEKLGADRPDAFALINQPYKWSGGSNPMVPLATHPSPSAAYGLETGGSAEAFFAAAFSKDRRKKLRKKEARLAEGGPITHVIATSDDQRAMILDAFLAQRLERFRAQNIKSDFDDPRMRRFIEAANRPGPHGIGIELHALFCGSRVVAVYGGAAHGGQWSGMFNSFDTDLDIARTSPGDLLLMRIIAAQTECGNTRLDLGIGEASYKDHVCNETIPLFDSFMAITPKGHLYLALRTAVQRAKRAIKQSPRAFAMAKRVRGLLPLSQ